MIATLAAAILAVSSPQPAAPPLVEDRLASLARGLPVDDVRTFWTTIMRGKTSRGISAVLKPPQAMPPDDPIAHFVKVPNGGEIWLTYRAEDATFSQTLAFREAVVAASIQAAVAEGVGGERWQRRFATSADPVLLGHAIARVVEANGMDPDAPPDEATKQRIVADVLAKARVADRRATEAARTVDRSDAVALYRSIYADPAPDYGSSFMIQMSARSMPDDDPLVHYVGIKTAPLPGATPGPTKPYPETWTTDAAAYNVLATGELARLFNDAMVAAMMRTAAETGRAGPTWKARFAAAPDPVLLAHAYARSISLESERAEAKAMADLEWTKQHVLIGMTRDEVYTALRTRRLVAYNSVYDPGKPLGSSPAQGCLYGTSTTPQFPTPGQALPDGPCAHRPPSRNFDPAHPDVFVDYNVASNLACGTSIHQHYLFDDRDRLKERVDGPEDRVCL